MLTSSTFLSYYHHDFLANTAVATLIDLVQDSKEKTRTALQTTHHLMTKHDHSAVVENALKYMIYHLPKEDMMQVLHNKKHELQKQLDAKTQAIQHITDKKIPNNGHVFVHGLTHHLVSALEHARKQKSFTVHVLEHNPMAFGALLKKHLKQDVILYPDTAIIQALEHADICLLGCEGFSKTQIMSKTGAKTVLSLCSLTGTTPYFVTHALHYIDGDLKGHTYDSHHDYMHVHELLAPEKTRFITEFGIINHQHLVEDTLREHTWMM